MCCYKMHALCVKCVEVFRLWKCIKSVWSRLQTPETRRGHIQSCDSAGKRDISVSV